MANEKLGLEKPPTPEETSLVYPKYPGGLEPRHNSYGYGYGGGDDDGGLKVREILRTARKHLWLILGVTVIVTAITTVEIFRVKHTFEAAALIEIGKEDVSPVKGANLVIQTDEGPEYMINLKTKIQALKSSPILEEVVARLQLNERPEFLESREDSIWTAVKRLTSRVSDSGPAEVQEISDVAELKLRDKKRSPEESAKLEPYVDVLNGSLTITPVPDTRDLRVSYTHTNAILASKIANTVADVFIERSFERKTEKFTKTSEWLDESTRKLQTNVQRAEKELADYTREHNIYSLEGKETLTTDKLARLHDQAMRAETDRILKQSLYEEVQRGHVADLPEAFADPKSNELQKQLNALKIEAANLDLKFGENHPKVIEVRQQIAAIEGQIKDSRGTLADRLKADYERATRDEQSLKQALDRAKSEASQQNQDAIQFNILKQDVDTAKSLYTQFLQNTSQADLEVAQQHNNLRLIQPARTPKVPVAPQRTRTIMMGLLLGLVGGVALAFFVEYMDNTIKTVEEVARYVQLPALGVIPAMHTISAGSLLSRNRGKRLTAGGKNGSQMSTAAKPTDMLLSDSRSSAAEAYRVLRTSVLLSSAGSAPKRILVTSGQPGEGKTTTVINTAISLSQLGSSVLIIDCDLRRPSVHKTFNLDHSRGLSTYLSRNIAIDGLIQKVQIPNLSVLPCGPIPPNPAELISSERMRDLLRDLSERYDHVLIDSPPIINVTDPIVLSTLVDGVILVVHGGKSTRAVAQRARQELGTVGAKIFGVVLNNVDLRHGNDDYYYYRYYSGYGTDANGRSDAAAG